MIRLMIAVAALVAAVSAASTSGAAPGVVVTRDAQSLPTGCTPRETAQLLTRFADAVSAGDVEALDRIFAIEDPPGRAVEPAGLAFRWYSVTEARVGAPQPWRHAGFYDRADVLRYFAERHGQHERWEPVSVEVTPSSAHAPGTASVTYTIRRTADDLPTWLHPIGSGKGGIDCAAGRIFVWSRFQHDRPAALGSVCPRPGGWSAGDAILACTEGPNARALASGFRLDRGSARLPGRCAPSRALGSLRSTLPAFNAGDGPAFAKRFSRDPLLTTGGATLKSRRKLEAFAYKRYSAGEGWTARVLRAPTRVGRAVALYRLSMLVSRPTEAAKPARARIVLDCKSGRIESWRGPTQTP